ncbi:DUF6147 family protein [Desulfallas thermosapovorans]|uniref:Uncharacterized protein n=1 Tax=Desulfallas thermosapovorans DSM 6562 TaxID=1121431 RepID=A0A5S4ZPH7_9FIRM|nr:DUF6147 family protein [Desulfallas thermosapovorans]TYO90927.1 hypothetical protein LX24_02977 [Desulfallas thermosapovorans DSM 6562]
MARKGILIFSVLLFCILLVSSAQAGELSESGGESSVFSAIGPEALQWLADGTCSITSNMNGTIKISGKTTAYSNVDVISLTLYLQKKVGSNWVSQGSWSFEDYGTNIITGNKVLAVPSGEYRAYALHSVIESGSKESGSSTSKAVSVR